MTIINVKDMHCSHCKMTIEKALKRKHINAEVDLENKQVKISDDADKEKALEAIKTSGFTPTL